MWPLLTGLLRAKEYILLGDRLPAEAAVQIGIANRVVPTGTSVEAALELAARIATLPPQAVRETKALLNQAVHNALDALLEGAHERDRVVRRAGLPRESQPDASSLSCSALAQIRVSCSTA